MLGLIKFEMYNSKEEEIKCYELRDNDKEMFQEIMEKASRNPKMKKLT